MQVSAGAVQVLGLQGGNLRDAKAAACHEPEDGGLSRGGGCGEEAVPLLKDLNSIGARGEILAHDSSDSVDLSLYFCQPVKHADRIKIQWHYHSSR